MNSVTTAAAAAHFGRDVDRALDKLARIFADARNRGVDLLVLPDATIGGYLIDMFHPIQAGENGPPAVALDSPEVRAVVEMAQEMTVCFGIAEDAGAGQRYNTAVCVSGDGVLGTRTGRSTCRWWSLRFIARVILSVLSILRLGASEC